MNTLPEQPDDDGDNAQAESAQQDPAADSGDQPVEIGGRDGPDPVRYGDWEKNGRCIDF